MYTKIQFRKPWWRHQMEKKFRVTGPLCGEFTGPRWIPRTKANDVELWYFLWSAPWINGWVNNRDAGDVKRDRAHHDVIVMREGKLAGIWCDLIKYLFSFKFAVENSVANLNYATCRIIYSVFSCHVRVCLWCLVPWNKNFRYVSPLKT